MHQSPLQQSVISSEFAERTDHAACITRGVARHVSSASRIAHRSLCSAVGWSERNASISETVHGYGKDPAGVTIRVKLPGT
jgi:hypothetical protein